MLNTEPPAALLLFSNHISGWVSLALPGYCLSLLIGLKVLVFLKLCVSSIFQQIQMQNTADLQHCPKDYYIILIYLFF